MFPGAAIAVARAVVDPLLTVVFPSFCVVCRAPLSQPTRGPLCQGCWTRLPRHQDDLCACGVPLGAGVPRPCGRCRRGRTAFEAGASLGPYEASLRTAIHELKYRGRRRLAGRLAEALLAEPAPRAVLSDAVVLVPVPLHPRRRRERGFNQSELIAQALGRLTRLPVAASALVRRQDTPSQSGLSAAERRRNVASAFVVRRRPAIAGRVVVIVDDVLTTGATARACASALRAAGARSVRLLTIARVA
jgi:ComF family protein